ncbi:MAG: hypothetical protein E6Y72_04635, partial [Klebsiella pneumoniae]|nr:hypothetical protein [Klebsiella pneumoniae]
MMTDYILSPCSLAARGLSQLMLNAAKRPVELPVEGVSLRELAAERCAAAGVELRVPRFSLCTDNGVMIAAVGAQLIHEGAQPSGLG